MKKFKSLAISLCVSIMLCFSVGLFSLVKTSRVYAEGNNNYFTVEEYTNSDKLFRSDGTSSLKDILEFAEEVKAGKSTYYPELAEVIPRQYLESQKKNATFAYNGKEYGFYVVKNEEKFDVLLIDFIYEFDKDDSIHNSDVEFRIRIKPLLQQTFTRSTDKTGAYTWAKTTTTTRYYVANPRFISVVKNENALNYGDDGYSKLTDDGVIISQFRTNYGKVSYATEKDLTKKIVKFTGKKLLNYCFDKFCAGLDAATFQVGGKVAKIFEAYIEFGIDLYKTGKEETVLADNESNIKTEMSREFQRNNPDMDGYSRIAGFAPKEELILSDANNSYAEFITVLNDANSRSRLYQCCDFDIVYRTSDYSSMSDPVAKDCTFSKERILYDNKSITELQDEVSQENFAYLLDGGNHRFSYQCNDTTGYRFIFDGQLPEIAITCNGETVETSKVNDNVYEAVFEKGKNYLITFSGLPAGIHNFTFCKKTENIDSFGERNIKSFAVGESKWFEYTPQKDKYLSIDCDTNKYGVYIYNSVKSENLTVNGCTNHTEFLALANQKYYVQIANDTFSELPAGKVTFDNVAELDLDKTVEIAVDGERTYRFNAPMYGRYKIIDLPSGISASFNASSLGDAYLLPQGEHYVTFSGRTAYGTCKICFDSTEIFVRGGSTFSINGNSPCVILKFKAPQTLDYNVSVPNNARLAQIFCGGVVTDVENAQSIRFEKGKVY